MILLKDKNNIRKVLKNNLIVRDTFHYYIKNINYICALNNINLTLENGKIYGLIGGSGSGKTTLGKILAGRLEPSQGIIRFGNLPINFSEDRFHKSIIVQIITQNAQQALNFYRTGWSVLRDVANEKDISELIDIFNLSLNLLSKPIFNLSGGEKQRIHLLRNWLLSPSIMIFDESFSALDAEVKHNISNLMKENKFGKIIIFITHDVSVMLNLCEELIFLHSGKIIKQMTNYDLNDIFEIFCEYNEFKDEIKPQLEDLKQFHEQELTKTLESFLK
jgi:peptide/nickel transport system ATP-binding protein